MDLSQDINNGNRYNSYKHHKKMYLQRESESNDDSPSNSFDSLLNWTDNSLVSMPPEMLDSYMQAVCLALNNMENEPMEKQFSYFEYSLSQSDDSDTASDKNNFWSGDYNNANFTANSAENGYAQFSKNYVPNGAPRNPDAFNTPALSESHNNSAFQMTQNSLTPTHYNMPNSSSTSFSGSCALPSETQNFRDSYSCVNPAPSNGQTLPSSSHLASVKPSSFPQPTSSSTCDNPTPKMEAERKAKLADKHQEAGQVNRGLSISDTYSRNSESYLSKAESSSQDPLKLPSKKALENFLSFDSPFAKKYGVNVSKLLLDRISRKSGEYSPHSMNNMSEEEEAMHGAVSSSTNPRSHRDRMGGVTGDGYDENGRPFDDGQMPDTSSGDKSSRKDRKWSLGTHNLCKVCGDKAAGYYCGAFVCEACKKFFMRASKQQKLKYCCVKDQKCVITKESRVQCQYCRYQKCLSLNMSCPEPGTSAEKKGEGEIADIPCRVCGAPSSGFHFGALTCEGCKGFFRRMAKERETRHYHCSKNERCEITSLTRNLCKACRYKKCIDAGMSIEASRIGRQPNSVKHAISLELQQMGQNPKECKLDFKNLNDPSKEFDAAEKMDTYSDFSEVKVKVEPQEGNTPPSSCCFKSMPLGSNSASSFSPSVQCSEDFEMKYQRVMVSIETMNTELLNLIVRSEKSKPENDPGNFTDHRKCWAFMLIEFESHAAVLIRFSKRITGFRKLPLDDQINLVQDSIYPIVILNQSRLFDLENKAIHYFNYTDWEHKKMLEYYPQLRELVNHFMHAGEIVKTVDFDPMEITFLSVLLLLNPDREGLENREFVEQLQMEFVEVLEEYERRTYSNGNLRFGLILLRLSEFHVFTVKHNIAVGVLLSEHPTLEMPQLYKEMFGAAVGGLFRRERNMPKFPAIPIPDDSVIQEELANNSTAMRM